MTGPVPWEHWVLMPVLGLSGKPPEDKCQVGSEEGFGEQVRWVGEPSH